MKTSVQGWVFYDGQCRICVQQADRWEPFFRRYGFKFAPQQEGWVQERLGLKDGQAANEMKVLTLQGEVRGGFDALLYLIQLLWWAKPLVWVARIPGIIYLLRLGYRQVAKSRYCVGGTCEVRNI